MDQDPSHSTPTTLSSWTSSISSSTSTSGAISTTAGATTTTSTAETYSSTSPSSIQPRYHNQDFESLHSHILSQLQNQAPSQLGHPSSLSHSPIGMSNPNTYGGSSGGGSGGGSSSGGSKGHGKGSSDKEILDGLMPRIETRGQSSRHHTPKKDRKKDSTRSGGSRR